MEQKHGNCKYYSFKSCYHSENEIMKQFLGNTSIPTSGGRVTLDMSKESDVDKLCAACPKFKQPT